MVARCRSQTHSQYLFKRLVASAPPPCTMRLFAISKEGKVMQELMPQIAGRAEGATIQQVVQKQLAKS